MERAYAPLVRQFSPIKGYQTGYTLVYSLDAAAEGSCQLTLARQGAQEQRVSMLVPLAWFAVTDTLVTFASLFGFANSNLAP